MQKAADDGIVFKKEWLATSDARTRDWHADLNGKQVNPDEPFENDFGKILYPGDPHAHPANVYNCRCTLVAGEIIGFKRKDGSIEYVDYQEHDFTVTTYAKDVDKSGGSGIINTDTVFHTKRDPMRDVFGSAEDSNPEEIKAIEQHFAEIGVELIREEHEKLGYTPALVEGQKGTSYISKGASYSAWLHEQKHVDDDMADGWLGMRVLQDTEKCAKREIDAYAIEIELAKKANRPDIVKRLEELRDEEIKKYTKR